MFRFSLLLAALALGAAHSAESRAADLIVYDNASENGFDQTCSSGATAADFDFANASPVHSAADSIRFAPDDINALSWCAPSAYSAVRDHSGISFWIYLSGDAGESSQLDLVLSHAGTVVASGDLQSLYGSPIPTNDWVQFQTLFPAAPLNYVGAFDQIALQDESGTIQANVYVDDVALLPADGLFDDGFEPPTVAYTVTAAANGGNGTIMPASQMVDAGGTATFSVVPDSNYAPHVLGDTCSVAQIGASDTWASSAITQDCAVTATFVLKTFNLTLSANGNGLGSIMPSPIGTSCGTGCYTYDYGTLVSITASPSTSSSFTAFSGGGCSTTNPCSINITTTTSVTATFTLKKINITLGTAGAGSGTAMISPAGLDCGANCNQYDYGTPVTITASPSSGSSFTTFSGGGCLTANPCMTTAITSATITAFFDVAPSGTAGQ